MPNNKKTLNDLKKLISNLTDIISGCPLDIKLQNWLNENVGPNSEFWIRLTTICQEGVRNGWLCNQQYSDGSRFNRAFEPSDDLHRYSVDVVEMTNTSAPCHLHPKGEIDMIIPQDECAHFEGAGAGWLVQPPGSLHAPVATGGRVLILYMLPEGEIDFDV